MTHRVIFAMDIGDNHYILVDYEGQLLNREGEFTNKEVVIKGKAKDSEYPLYVPYMDAETDGI